ncbi:hypothetical protein ig2599ANME_0181 [groundwater metagenome]
MITAFGLDIAGYSTGKSGFVRADRKDDNLIEITVFKEHSFAKICDSKTSLENDIVKNEKELLIACCKKGRLLVDIPIDLQGLPCPKNVRFIWELVKRPVDFAFEAMPPLANLIGYPVARFLNLFSSIQEDKDPLGKQIFETYPAGSLKLLKSQMPNLPNNKYKKQQTTFRKGIWNSENGINLSKIANCLKLTSEKEITLNDDELDAIICAITGVVDEKYCLYGDELSDKMKKLKGAENFSRICAPAGYVLLKSLSNMKIGIIEKNGISHKELLQEVER